MIMIMIVIMIDLPITTASNDMTSRPTTTPDCLPYVPRMTTIYTAITLTFLIMPAHEPHPVTQSGGMGPNYSDDYLPY